MNLSKIEKETIILFNDEEEQASFYTCNKGWQNKLDKLSQKSKDVTLQYEGDCGRAYSLPKSYIKVRLPKVITEENRQKMAQLARERFGSKGEGKDEDNT